MRRILSGQALCAQCGLQNAPNAPFCASCGIALGIQTPTAPPPSAPAAVAVAKPPAKGNGKGAAITGMLGKLASRQHVRLTGVVIQVEPPQSTPPTFRLVPFFIKTGIVLGIAAFFGVVGLAVVMVVFLLSMLASIVFGARSRGGGHSFFKSILTQVTGFFLTSRLLTPKPFLPVNHIRIRDSAGVEHLIRIEGYMLTGRPSVGDDISVEGSDRSGTLDMHRGWNNRIRSEIRLKR